MYSYIDSRTVPSYINCLLLHLGIDVRLFAQSKYMSIIMYDNTKYNRLIYIKYI